MTHRLALARLAVVIAAVTVVPAPASAAPDDDLSAAQQRANRAAEELARAEEELARAEAAVSQLQTRVSGIESRVAQARQQVRQLAVRLYVDGPSHLALILRIADANHLVRAQQFAHVVAGTTTDSLEQYRADRDDLRDELARLEAKQDVRAAALEDLRRRRADAITEVARLADEDRERRARAAREEQARTVTNPTPARPQAQAPVALGASPALSPPTPSPPAPRPTAAVEPAPAGGGSSGWVCPVQGPHAFSDDYGAPRGGGYTHLGNDILAPKGTPVVANVDGVVTQRSGAISGLAYYLAGDDGDTYFGAHLDSFGASGRVTAGTVIGAVGNTGDAAGGPPHLHFEIHPGGSGNINPYPTLSRYC